MRNFTRTAGAFILAGVVALAIGGCNSGSRDSGSSKGGGGTTGGGSTVSTQLTDISPSDGPLAGGTTVDIVGDGFTNPQDTEVFFDGQPATNVQVQDAKNLTCETPAGNRAGFADVRVSSSNGDATVPQLFEYRQVGSFVDAVLPGSSDSRDVSLLDADGDGDLDAFLACVGQDRLLIHDGQGNFADETSARLPQLGGPSRTSVAADIDGDGDDDIILGHGTLTGQSQQLSSMENVVLVNDGSGHFSVDDDALPDDQQITTELQAADLDDDGDIDIFASSRGYDTSFLIFFSRHVGEENRLYLNDGSGNFSDETRRWFGLRSRIGDNDDDSGAVKLGDVDADGDDDYFAANFSTDGAGAKNKLGVNDGGATFSTGRGIIGFLLGRPRRLPTIEDDTVATELVDLDADGDLDIVCCNIQANGNAETSYVLMNDGDGYFERAQSPEGFENDPGPLHGAAGIDADGDGHRDILTIANVATHVWANDGQTSFSQVATGSPNALPPLTQAFHGMAVEDLDGDGDADVVLVGSQDDVVLINQ